MKAQFKVQHEILAGLKYLQKVTRMGVSNKMQEMMVCSTLVEPRAEADYLDRARTDPAQKRSRSTRRSVSTTQRLHMFVSTDGPRS